MKKICGLECYKCIICKGKKICCSCDWNNGYHACVKWLRGGSETNKNKSRKTHRTNDLRDDSSQREKEIS